MYIYIDIHTQLYTYNIYIYIYIHISLFLIENYDVDEAQTAFFSTSLVIPVILEGRWLVYRLVEVCCLVYRNGRQCASAGLSGAHEFVCHWPTSNLN